MYGYDKIPSFWLNPLKEVEDFTFEGTNMSLAKAYQMSFDQAKQLIVKTGGKVSGGEIEIPIKKADILPLEQNFENTYPLYRERKDCFLTDTFEFDFNGNGFVIWGNIAAQEVLLPIISIGYLHATSVPRCSDWQSPMTLTLLKWKYGLTENWTM